MNEQVRRYLASRFCAGTALMMLRAAVAWHMYRLTGSELLLGLIGLVHFIPAVAMLLGGGILADRMERVTIVRRAQYVSLCVSPLLAAATFAGIAHPGVLYAAVAITAAAGALEQPARATLLISLVPRGDFPRVVTQAATVQALAFASGPALAGGLIAVSGAGAAYAAHALLMLGSVIALRGLGPARPEPNAVPPVQAMREGFAYVLQNRVVLGCMALDMCAVILGGATALLPVYAEDILQVGPVGYGMLSAALEVGALTTALVLMVRRPISHAGRALLLSVVGYGAATLMFGLSRSLPLSLVAYALVGAFDQVSVVMRHTAVQLETPDALRGRVSAINMLFIQASNHLGAFESGLLAAATSATFAVCFGGGAAIAVAAIFALAFPALRAYRVTGEMR